MPGPWAPGRNSASPSPGLPGQRCCTYGCRTTVAPLSTSMMAPYIPRTHVLMSYQKWPILYYGPISSDRHFHFYYPPTHGTSHTQHHLSSMRPSSPTSSSLESPISSVWTCSEEGEVPPHPTWWKATSCSLCGPGLAAVVVVIRDRV